MTPVTLKLRLNDIDGVSDRTARALLKDLTKIARRAQMREVEYILKAAKLDRREIQSLRDKLIDQAADAPAYYLQYARAGSIEVGLMLGATVIWVLQNTLGETLKDAWKETTVHREIIDWVKNKREKKMAKILRDESKKHDFLGGRAHAVRTSDKDGAIEITLEKHEYIEIGRDHKIDEEVVVTISEEALRHLDGE